MTIKVVKIVEEITITPMAQATRMVAKAKQTVNREGGKIVGRPQVKILVEQEFDDGD